MFPQPDNVLPDTCPEGWQQLASLRSGPLPVERFLPLALAICDALMPVQGSEGCYGQLSPETVFVRSPDLQVALYGTCPPEHLLGERTRVIPAARTLPYLAPEQSGRIGQRLDARSDCYALGVIFYELLTGAQPFEAGDALEWVHAHMARVPQPPHIRHPGVPQALSDIVMKMLEKSPDRRYQSTAGLRADLAHCWQQWQAAETIPPFAIGRHDIAGRFRTLRTLYGRSEDLAAVREAYQRVVDHGASGLLLLSGPAGVGKSAVAEALEQEISAQDGTFIAGKFDQYKRHMPFSVSSGILSQLVDTLLASDEETLQGWQERLQKALGGNAALLFDLIPQCRLLLGEQPLPPPLPAREAQRRFFATLRSFMMAFAGSAYPLAIFLDDLQWSDADTLAFLNYLLLDTDTPNILVIGSYRDNEVTAQHPLAPLLERAHTSGLAVTEVRLGPLSAADFTAMIADALGIGPGRARRLAALIHRKTAGIPLFALHFLHRLEREGHLRHDPAGAGWQWDLDAIHAQGYSDNVVDLMLDAVRTQLPDAALEVLEYAACIGYVVDLGLLARVSGSTEQAVRSALREALHAGFVDLVDRRTLRFAHDRIQQAVYALIPRARRSSMHLEIARCLLAVHAPGPADQGDDVFDIADQFNLGRADVATEDERRQLMEVNLRAGIKAKQAGAHASAAHYLDLGLRSLRPSDFDSAYSTACALYFEQASCCYLLGRTEEAGALLGVLLAHARDRSVRAQALHLKIELLSALADNAGALAALRECTALFGITIPEQATAEQALAEEEKFWAALGSRPIASLAAIEAKTQDASYEFLLDSLLIATPQANVHSLELLHLLSAHAANISLRYGSKGEAALSYALLGMICSIRNDIGRARELEAAALQLVHSATAPVPERYRAPVLLAAGGLIGPCTRPLRAGLADLLAAFDAALRSDEPVAANMACEYIVEQRCALGDPLETVQQDLETRIAFAEQTAYKLSRPVLEAWHAYVRNLRGQSRHFLTFDSDGFDERGFERRLEESLPSPVHFVYFSLKLQSRFLFGDPANAMQAADRAWAHARYALGSFQRSEFHFYRALAASALYRTLTADSAGRQHCLDVLRDAFGRLAIWQEHCPENHAARFHLARAELAAVEGDRTAAMDAYVRAIETAAEQDAIHVGALAHELAAMFCQEHGAPRLRDTLLATAIGDYGRWGAAAKAAQLRQRFPLLAGMPSAAPAPADGARDTDIDRLAMAKAAQAIAGEVTTGRLHATLLRTLLEHVGAGCAHVLECRRGSFRLKESARYEDNRFQLVRHADTREAQEHLPSTVIQYVTRARTPLVLDDACRESAFARDAYFLARQQCAVLCLPILRQNELVGVLYLENSQLAGAFARVNLQVLEWLLAQVAVSMENAALYEDLHESEERLSVVMDYVPACVYMKDLEARYLFVNREFEKTFGVTLADALARSDVELLQEQPEALESVRKADLVALRGETIRVEEQIVVASGATHTFLSVKTPLYAKQEIKGLCGISMDISEQKRARERIEYLAHYDLLTGLPNRNLLADRIDQALAEARRTGSRVALMVLDLDRFKVINDSLGHRVGDLLLQEMAVRLKACVREGDTVARLGGDSFVIIAPGLEDSTVARTIAVKASDSVAGPYRLGSVQAAASVCIGISLFPDDAQDGGALLQYAEMAMYQAKPLGHKSLRFYDEAMDQRAQERLRMENELRAGIANGELYLMYQPQIDLRDRHVMGAEALVRWAHPVRGLISPALFIPLAEECGLISDISEWAIGEVCNQLRRWKDSGLPDVSLAVNVSARNVQHDDLYGWVERALAASGIDGRSLELEMTEGTLMTDMETSIEKLVALKRLGIRTSIDDFGTGYSSLSYLKRLPVDKLKIDQSFVRDISRDPNDAAITSAIIAMGKQLNLKVIAEGVEDSDAERFLLKHRCDQMQGYLFSPPVAPEAFAAMLS
jgi:diguanylate cyclase (GGDEF)-like protein/PAS domain S-box-containing protein